MDNAKENEDESELSLPHPPGPDMPIEAQLVPAIEHLDEGSPPHLVPMDQDEKKPSENVTLPSAAAHVDDVELKSSLQKSHRETPSIDNRSELQSSPQQKSQTAVVPTNNFETNPQQPQTELVTSDNNVAQTEAMANDGMGELRNHTQKPQTEAVPNEDDMGLKTISEKPLAAPNSQDVNLKSIPKQQGTEASTNDVSVELESSLHESPQGSSSPAPVDDKKSLLKPETEPTIEKRTTANEFSDCKSKTCGIDGTANSICHLETAKPAADAKTEPSEVPENKSGHHDGTHPKEDEPTTPHAVSSIIKTELENKRELKNAKNKAEEATLKSNGTSSSKNTFLLDDDHDGDETGTEEEQCAFMMELENFFRERSMEFKPPKFYGEGLNCLKLWRAVMRLGGYDKVTSCKLWRQVGESFKPPKTCTTVSWTFRGFYEKALLDYERHKTCGGELNVPLASNSEPMNVENQTPGSGRARRDAAARAMQGWHSQRLLGNGEVSDPIIKDKNSISLQKREKQLKSLGLLKRKKPSFMEHAVKVARTKTSKPQLDVEVVDLGPPAEWVKINVQKTKDCFEVYALVPGLLREEVRVQSDPAGRLVISGEPEYPDNPWGVTPFRKVVSLPSRIDPHQTSAVVTLHGQLFVRVPFEQPD
ncbi:hypothetical protein JCGZ_24296 [Jatropha curcas]|uniref:ARID domain-containing protein n=1 Tax=Jatropha curcas TaxID=180498 RepID=A0A067JQ21_JATCU|nr:AT-rich interactive domain-containing protein 5 [Jatropha curcas]XP_012087577.1 AT-rich interactive domain-containing protein 5 [Jatropha curcas]KDP24918.1 hypothetical protein JCGZ_24296 [Jatropha curcas]